MLMSKVENQEGVTSFGQALANSLMVASNTGDFGVEISFEKLFLAQKLAKAEGLPRDSDVTLHQINTNMIQIMILTLGWSKELQGDCCYWTGVVCDDAADHILELHLSDSYNSSRLSGAEFGEMIPYQLRSLSNLLDLRLDEMIFGLEKQNAESFMYSVQKLIFLRLNSSVV
ncbi:hypothetical protein ACLB2K_050386 [Fragaria x ananassa]